MTRRDAIKVMGAGAALVGMGALPKLRAADGAPAADTVTQPFVLPKLAYAFDALEPHIDALTMEIHYSKHHAAYIKNANKALDGHPELAAKTGEELLMMLPSFEEPLRTTLRNNVGGHVNHTFWWSILSPQGGGVPVGALGAAVTREFGSYEAFKTLFTEAAMKRFGSGWAWLVSKGGRLSITSTANQDSPVSAQLVPLIGLDVWEHAYYLKHQNVRADYVKAFWSVVDWTQAGARYVPLAPVAPADS